MSNLDYEKIDKMLNTIDEYLKSLNIPFNRNEILLDPDTKEKLPVIETVYKHKNKEFLVILGGDGTWIRIKALVAKVDDLPANKLQYIYQQCLYANFVYDEVTFSSDRNGNIFVEADMLATSDLESFKHEFFSIAVGIDFFENLLEKLGSEAKSTRGFSIENIIYS